MRAARILKYEGRFRFISMGLVGGWVGGWEGVWCNTRVRRLWVLI